jgi:hypothetical protein
MPILILQAIVGGLTGWFAYRALWRICRIPAVAWGTLLLTSFYPPLVVVCLRLEPIAILGLLLAVGLWFLSAVFRDCLHIVFFMAAAVVFSIAIYFSPKILAVVPILGLWCGIRAHHRAVGILGAVAFCLACLVALMPWMARNFLALGSFVPLTTGFSQTIERSLADLTAGTNPKPPDGIGTRVEGPSESSLAGEPAAARPEMSRYRESLGAAFRDMRSLGLAGYGRLLRRGIVFWVTEYPELFSLPAAGVTEGEEVLVDRALVVRVVSLTVTILIPVLALVGIAASFPCLNAWVLWFLLGIATLVSALLGSPSYDHLPYWPYLAGFAVWGGRWFFSLISVPDADERDGEPFFVPNIKENVREESPSVSSHGEEESNMTPLWPVPENQGGNLEPIRGTAWPTKRLRKPSGDEGGGLGPVS